MKWLTFLLMGTLLLSSKLWAGDSGVISIGFKYACGLTTSGEIVCWGDGATTPPSGTFTQIAAESAHACALKTDGSIACWGSNSSGESIPPLGTFTWVATGYNFSCAIKQADSRVVCWGSSSDGKTAPPAETFTQIALGSSHACGLTTAGNIKCWGYDSYGQTSEAPVGQFTQLTADENSTCAIKSDQTVVCWGGIDTPSWLASLTSVAQVSYIINRISYSDYQNLCVLRTDGSAYCEEEPVSGQFVYIAAGSEYSKYQCGLESSGTLTCTGNTSYNTIPAPSGYTFKQPSDIVINPPSSCTQAELNAKYNEGYQAGLAAGGGGTTSAIRLMNISTRANIGGGAYDIIAGFIITGTGTKKVLIRGLGKGVGFEPGLNATLKLEKYPSGELVTSNDNWQLDPRASEIPVANQPPDPSDAAFILDLVPGAYTATMSSIGTTGIGLIDVTEMQ